MPNEAAPRSMKNRGTSGLKMNDSTSDTSHSREEKPTTAGKAKRKARSGPERERDRKLVAAVQEGKHDAFRELFDLYSRRAYAVALGVVKSPHDAMDIVQDAFVKVHKHIHNFQGTSSFYTWLYRIVMNLSIDHLRKGKRARQYSYDDQIERPDDGVNHELSPSILDSNPQKNMLRRELGGALEHALDTLSEHHRSVIILREVEGLSYEEMAKILEVPKGTIMSRLFHARKKMQEELQTYLNADSTSEMKSSESEASNEKSPESNKKKS